MTPDIDTMVVGAGVIGLAIAHKLANAGHDVVVLEQHNSIGTETSSRNSEVIHAGLYYAPGSLKARLCIEGKSLLYRFAAENGITVKRIGKLLVACDSDEVSKLEDIASNALANGVDDLVYLSAAEAQRMEPALNCVAAYLSPSTGIIDVHALLLALEGHLQAAGGSVVLASPVAGITRSASGFRLELAPASKNGENAPEDSAAAITCRRLVLAAGLHTSKLATQFFQSEAKSPAPKLVGYSPPETYYAKGHYFSLAGHAPFSRLIYPMPGAGGLGIHLTLDTAGAARFGPDVSWIDAIDYAFEDPDGARHHSFAQAIRRWWPDLPEHLLAPGYTGIRPKLAPQGSPPADFAIHGPETHGVQDLLALYGIESPGLTASLALAQYAADLLTT